MIEIEEAWRVIDAEGTPLPHQRVDLADALHSTLAEAAIADGDHPPFDRSTVDGYAIRLDDPSDVFTTVGVIAAGESKCFEIGPGQAVRIFTGAQLPCPDLQVVMQEDAILEGGTVRFARRGRETNISKRGEDVRAGDVLIAAGTGLTAAAISILASVGRTHPLVVRPPKVLHVTTGNEIVPIEEMPGPGKIRNTNAALIRALLGEYPAIQTTHVHLPDDEERALSIVQATGPASFDMILFSGGASVGDYDFTGRLLEALGYTIHFSQVNVRPGKPLVFASNGRKLAFGIPGNPVSHFVCFHLFIARALAALLDRRTPVPVEAELAGAIPGKPNPRVTYWPARMTLESTRCRVVPLPWNSSGHLASLLGVDALIRVEAKVALPKPGSLVQTFRI